MNNKVGKFLMTREDLLRLRERLWHQLHEVDLFLGKSAAAKGGEARALKLKEEKADRNDQIFADYLKASAGSESQHFIVGKLAQKWKRSPQTIRRIIKQKKHDLMLST